MPKLKLHDKSLDLTKWILGEFKRDALIDSDAKKEIKERVDEIYAIANENAKKVERFDEFGLSLAAMNYSLDMINSLGSSREGEHKTIYENYADHAFSNPQMLSGKIYIVLEEPNTISLQRLIRARKEYDEIEKVKLNYFKKNPELPTYLANQVLLLGAHAITFANGKCKISYDQENVYINLPELTHD